MTEQSLLPPLASNAGPDRRRPGRTVVSLALIPLLREPPAGPMPDEISDSDPDTLKAASGILFGVLLSIPFWALIVFLARLTF